jgi:hypothetical protein
MIPPTVQKTPALSVVDAIMPAVPRWVEAAARPAEEVAGQLLRRGGRLRIKARGGSMLPFVRDGDVALVTAAEGPEIRVGDVICYETSPGRLFLHRVIARADDRFVARGDALPFSEVVSRAQLLGRVVAVERQGRLWRLDTPMARWRNRSIVAVSPLVARLLPLALRLRRAWRGAVRG